MPDVQIAFINKKIQTRPGYSPSKRGMLPGLLCEHLRHGEDHEGQRVARLNCDEPEIRANIPQAMRADVKERGFHFFLCDDWLEEFYKSGENGSRPKEYRES